MKENFAPFELAVELKEKGFNEPCYGYYHRGGGDNSFEVCGNGDCDFLNSKNKHRIAAPTISQVLKWLREKYSIHISTKPYPCEDGIMWMYEIRIFNEYKSVVVANKTGFIKEEEANIAGIEYVLDNLI